MKTKLLVGALAIAFAGAASATTMTVDAAIGWQRTDDLGIPTGSTGTLAAADTTDYLGSNTLSDSINKPTFGYIFNIGSAAAIAGWTFSYVQWSVSANVFAGGSATSTNTDVGYSVASKLSSETSIAVGTTLGASNVLLVDTTAGGSYTTGLGKRVYVGTPLSLTDSQIAGATAGFVNLGNAFSIDAYAQAVDTFSSNGNSDSSFQNFANVQVLAQYVYTKDSNLTPEPATLLLVGLGLLGAVTSRRGKKA